ncbi:MAG: sialidase family protein [Acidimicrobiales bacterium]
MQPSAGRRGVPLLWAFTGFGLLALGAGLVVIGSSRSGRSVAVDGREAPIARGATDATDLRANNSPTLARDPLDPDHLVVVNRIDLPQYSCALHESRDGGRTWEAGTIPFPDGEERPERCFAPDAVFDSEGALYVSFVTLIGLGNSPNALWVASRDRDATALGIPRRVEGPRTFQVRLVADPRTPGGLYLTWLQADAVGVALFPNTGNPVVLSTSDDGGETWSAPVRVSAPERQRVVAPSPAVGDPGQLWVLYLDLKDDRLDYHGGHEFRGGEPYGGTFSLVLARSSDDGATWDETVVDDAIVPNERFLVFLPQSPSLAVDAGRDRVFAGFSDGQLDDPDVWVRVSDDGGGTFGPRRRVNDTVEGDGTAQYLPRLAVAPSGRLDVVYYDRRADPSNVRNEVSYQTSFDGAGSFTPRLRLTTGSFDSRIGFGSVRGLPDLGSRLGLLAGEERSLAVWTDTRAGLPETGKQDLAIAAVQVDEGDSLRGPLATGGWALVGAGVLLLVASAMKAARRRPSSVVAGDDDAGPAAADPVTAGRPTEEAVATVAVPPEIEVDTVPTAGDDGEQLAPTLMAPPPDEHAKPHDVP